MKISCLFKRQDILLRVTSYIYIYSLVIRKEVFQIEKPVVFIVEGEPKGKARPKFRRFGNFTRTYTPKATVEYEDKVRKSFLDAVDDEFTPLEGAVETDALCVFQIPKSVSKKKQSEMDGQPALRKPDTDNIIKSILDPLNGIAYKDDSQVCKISGLKIYGKDPRVEITIKPYKKTIIKPVIFLNELMEEGER